MLGSSCPGGTLAEVAGEQLWFGCLLNPSPAFAQILLGGFVANGVIWIVGVNIAITLIDLIVTIRLAIPTGVMSLIVASTVLLHDPKFHPPPWNQLDALARAYAKRGNAQQAIRYYSLSLQANPHNTWARQKLKEMGRNPDALMKEKLQ